MSLVESEIIGTKIIGWDIYMEIHHTGIPKCINCYKENLYGKKILYYKAFTVKNRILYKSIDKSIHICPICDWDEMEGKLRREIDSYKDYREISNNK